MALEYAKQKINVNCLAPGTIRTAMMKPLLDIPEICQLTESTIPYPRLGLPEDIAHAAVYLASSESDFMTGQTMVVDGGYTIK
jgi:NAD(P)-dependent dehydrogenase (short-subunit alcohol dehydrogenase family)